MNKEWPISTLEIFRILDKESEGRRPSMMSPSELSNYQQQQALKPSFVKRLQH